MRFVVFLALSRRYSPSLSHSPLLYCIQFTMYYGWTQTHAHSAKRANSRVCARGIEREWEEERDEAHRKAVFRDACLSVPLPPTKWPPLFLIRAEASVDECEWVCYMRPRVRLYAIVAHRLLLLTSLSDAITSSTHTYTKHVRYRTRYYYIKKRNCAYRFTRSAKLRLSREQPTILIIIRSHRSYACVREGAQSSGILTESLLLLLSFRLAGRTRMRLETMLRRRRRLFRFWTFERTFTN